MNPTHTPTPAKKSLRGRLAATQKLLNLAITNAEHGTLVANAMFWKLGLKNRNEIKAIVDEYMAFMHAKVEETRKGSFEVMPDFLSSDPSILAKVAEHVDSTETDSQE